MKFIMLINVKMPTIVGILTFISMINTKSERFKARKVIVFSIFRFYEQLNFHAQLSWASKKFYNLRTSNHFGGYLIKKFTCYQIIFSRAAGQHHWTMKHKSHWPTFIIMLVYASTLWPRNTQVIFKIGRWFDLILYVPVNNFSVMSGRVFLG